MIKIKKSFSDRLIDLWFFLSFLFGKLTNLLKKVLLFLLNKLNNIVNFFNFRRGDYFKLRKKLKRGNIEINLNFIFNLFFLFLFFFRNERNRLFVFFRFNKNEILFLHHFFINNEFLCDYVIFFFLLFWCKVFEKADELFTAFDIFL